MDFYCFFQTDWQKRTDLTVLLVNQYYDLFDAVDTTMDDPMDKKEYAAVKAVIGRETEVPNFDGRLFSDNSLLPPNSDSESKINNEESSILQPHLFIQHNSEVETAAEVDQRPSVVMTHMDVSSTLADSVLEEQEESQHKEYGRMQCNQFMQQQIIIGTLISFTDGNLCEI